MMTDGSITRVKQEIERKSCCSPTPSIGNQSQSMLYNSNSQVSMMTDSSISRVKHESETKSYCSPTPSTGNQGQPMVYNGNSQVSIMADNSISRVKLEIETTSCCSPTPSIGNQGQSMVYNSNSQASPGSPDRQFCSSTTTTYGEVGGDSSNLNSIQEEQQKRSCLVCGDTASGFHYGVASCEACKAFFKRTIQGSIEYTCPSNNKCEINKRRRKACQACRFQKCLVMGMLKEGVRLDRVRGGRQKYRRNTAPNPHQMQLMYQSTISKLEDIKILGVLNNYEPDPLTVNRDYDDNSNVFDDNHKNITTYIDTYERLCILSELYDKELVGVIGWAKQVPGFTELPLNDQMKLLQVSWTEILTLQLAYRSIPFNGELYFATNFGLDEKSAKDCGATEMYYHCVQITQRLERLSPMKEEYYLLKALALSNCDIRLDDQLTLRKLRDSILGALNDCVYFIRHNSALSHQQQLLLLLPSLRQADNIIRKFWMNIYREGKVEMNKLFSEMLESVSR